MWWYMCLHVHSLSVCVCAHLCSGVGRFVRLYGVHAGRHAHRYECACVCMYVCRCGELLAYAHVCVGCMGPVVCTCVQVWEVCTCMCMCRAPCRGWSVPTILISTRSIRLLGFPTGLTELRMNAEGTGLKLLYTCRGHQERLINTSAQFLKKPHVCSLVPSEY